MMDYLYFTKRRNFTTNPTTQPVPDYSPCRTTDKFYEDMETYSLIASAAIIICLSLLEKRSNRVVCRCAGGRPGLIYPVNLLDHGCDNFGYSMAFGSVASYCFNLFLGTNSIYTTGPEWSTTLYLMLYVLMVGLMFYPLFACLTTTWVFVGSALGLAYTTLWIFFNTKVLIQCPNGADDGLAGQNIAVQVPVLFCLLCLFFRYGIILIKHVIHIIKERRVDDVIKQYEREHLGTKFNMQYVKELLVPACPSGHPSNTDVEPTWQKRLKVYLRRYIYMNDPTFKYSPRIICIFTVALICAYKFGILILLGSYQILDLVHLIYPEYNSTITDHSSDDSSFKQLRLLLRVSSGSMLFSFCISSLLTLFSIFQILTSYRQNMKRMYKGDFSHLPFRRHGRHPQFIMSDSLSYAGSQIAYTLWGYIIVFVVLVITCVVLMYLIVLPAFNLISRDILKILWNTLYYILMSYVLYLFIYAINHQNRVPVRTWVLLIQGTQLMTRTSVDEKGRDTSTVVLALNNRKVYHNVSYFLFFFYIVLGIFGCFLTITKGVILGIMHLARLDKCGLIPGYETWDKGHMYYVSFLYIEECHRHPVLLVFCDMLLDNIDEKKNCELRNYGSVESIEDKETYVLPDSDQLQAPTGAVNNAPRPHRPIRGPKRLAINRWLKAYTMIRNKGLKAKEIEEDYTKLDDKEIPFAKNHGSRQIVEEV